MSSFVAWRGPITAAIAEAEPERERLFSRPPRTPTVTLPDLPRYEVPATIERLKRAAARQQGRR